MSKLQLKQIQERPFKKHHTKHHKQGLSLWIMCAASRANQATTDTCCKSTACNRFTFLQATTSTDDSIISWNTPVVTEDWGASASPVPALNMNLQLQVAMSHPPAPEIFIQTYLFL